jgi:hypothetical protein
MEAKNSFHELAKHIETAYPISYLNDFKEYTNYYKGLSIKETEYLIWCAENRLFINPLNDIFTESVVSNDYLFMPNVILKFNEKPICHSISIS